MEGINTVAQVDCNQIVIWGVELVEQVKLRLNTHFTPQ
jgi:hypothetical protein